MVANTITLVSRASGVAGAKQNTTYSTYPSPQISADGRYVAFLSKANNLSPDDTDFGADVYVRDLQANTTTLASRASGVAGAKANASTNVPELSISDDGRYVAFASCATNLSPDDTDTLQDIYVRDLQTNTTTLASRAPGLNGAKANARSEQPHLSADGRYVTFGTNATNLSPDDTVFPSWDIYLRDLQTGAVTLVSRADGPNGASQNTNGNTVGDPKVSADGRYVAFEIRRDEPEPGRHRHVSRTSTCATWWRHDGAGQPRERSCGAKGGTVFNPSHLRRRPLSGFVSYGDLEQRAGAGWRRLRPRPADLYHLPRKPRLRHLRAPQVRHPDLRHPGPGLHRLHRARPTSTPRPWAPTPAARPPRPRLA